MVLLPDGKTNVGIYWIVPHRKEHVTHVIISLLEFGFKHPYSGHIGVHESGILGKILLSVTMVKVPVQILHAGDLVLRFSAQVWAFPWRFEAQINFDETHPHG